MRILVVEKEHKIARSIKQSLEQEGYDVDSAYDSDEGSSAAVSQQYDLIILDEKISNKSGGGSIVNTMRNAKVHTPVLMLTDKKTDKNRSKIANGDADGYLAKPFSLSQIMTNVRKLVRRSSPTESILSAGDLHLDTETYAVTRAGKNINLTTKEFALLEYLLRNQDRPSSKETIVAYVWDYEADVLLNTVEVYVKYLRAKIDDPFDSKILKTVRGFGYKIDSSPNT